MTVIEAMQRGVPVLVSDRSAAAEAVRHDIDGLHVAAGSNAAWVASMSSIQDPDRIARYSRSCFDISRTFLDANAYRARLLAIYRTAAAGQRSAGLQALEAIA